MDRLPRVLLAMLVLAAGSVEAREIVVLGLFPGKAVLRIDGVRRVLAEGELSPEGVRLVASDSEGAELEVDGVRERLALGNHIGSTFKGSAQRQVQIFPDRGGMYTATGSINGYVVSFLVDTGATFVSLNAGEARRLGIDFRRGKTANVETASGHEKAYQVVLDSISVGEIKVSDVPALVLDGPMPSRILLGMSFLNRLEMERSGTALLLRSKW